MARQLTIALLIGLTLFSVVIVVHIGASTRGITKDFFEQMGSQNANLGARFAESQLERGVSNGIISARSLFADEEVRRSDSAGPIHTDYDRFLERAIESTLYGFVNAEYVYYAYVQSNSGYIPVHTDKTKQKQFLPIVEESSNVDGNSGSSIWEDQEGYIYYDFWSKISINGLDWGRFHVGIPVGLVSRQVWIAVGAVGGIALLYSMLFAAFVYLVLRYSLNPLSGITRITQRLGAGDLRRTERRSGPRRFGLLGGGRTSELRVLDLSVESMADNLRDSVGAMRQVVQQLLANSAQIQTTSTALAAATAEQSSAIAQTTATVEEVKQSGQAGRRSAEEIVDMSKRALQVSARGLEAVRLSAEKTRELNEQVQDIVRIVSGFRERVQEIESIIGTVDGIAGQSKLLSVNASIEAAKAGEFGRGFAVVAQEVKKLAEQSKQATETVRRTLNTIRTSIDGAYSSARSGEQTSRESVERIEHTGEAVKLLSEEVERAAHSAQAIAIGINEQAVGLEQVAIAMSSINGATASTTTSTQHLKQSGDGLRQIAEDLSGLIDRYELDEAPAEQGADVISPPPTAPRSKRPRLVSSSLDPGAADAPPAP